MNQWAQDQLDRKARAEAGECVVANMRKGGDTVLLAWAIEQKRFVRIDRKTEWGNPFEMDEPGKRKDGDRDTVCDAYIDHYLPFKPSLLKRLPTLRGMVLGCWCHPERCHGHTLADLVNRPDAAGQAPQNPSSDEKSRQGRRRVA